MFLSNHQICSISFVVPSGPPYMTTMEYGWMDNKEKKSTILAMAKSLEILKKRYCSAIQRVSCSLALLGPTSTSSSIGIVFSVYLHAIHYGTHSLPSSYFSLDLRIFSSPHPQPPFGLVLLFKEKETEQKEGVQKIFQKFFSLQFYFSIYLAVHMHKSHVYHVSIQ